MHVCVYACVCSEMLASRCPPPLSPNYTCKAYLKTTTFRRPPTILTAAASRFRVRLLKSPDNNRNKRARRRFVSLFLFLFLFLSASREIARRFDRLRGNDVGLAFAVNSRRLELHKTGCRDVRRLSDECNFEDRRTTRLSRSRSALIIRRTPVAFPTASALRPAAYRGTTVGTRGIVVPPNKLFYTSAGRL